MEKSIAKPKRRRKNSLKKITDEQIIQAIRGSAGIIMYIAKRLGVGWHSAQKLVNRNENTRQAYRDELENLYDTCEMALLKAIHEGDTHTAKWWLAQRARHRGYGEKLELSGDINNNLQGKIEIKVIGVDKVSEH